MKRVLGLVLAGLVGAGTLFSGVGVAHAEGEAKQEQLEDVVLEQNSEEVINDQVDAGGGLSSSEEEMETSGENDAKEGVQEKVLSSVNDEFKILRFTADKTEVNPGDAITFSLETTDNTKVDNVYAKFTSEDGNDSLGVFIYNVNNSSSLVQTEQITNTYAGKTFTLRSISVEDGWGGELFSSNDVIPEIGNLSIKVGEVTDTSAPEIQSITLDKESVKPGENITVTIDATDLSGLDYNNLGEYSVTFVRETDDEEMLFNINSGSDGKFIATNEISNKDKNGKYILKSISGPKDVAGNCFNAETHEESRYIGELSFEIVDSDESTEGWVIKNGSESIVSYGRVIQSNENENIYFDEETATLHLKDFNGHNLYYMYYSEETESHPVGADYSKGKTLTLKLSGNNTVQKLSNHYNQYDSYDTGLDKLVIAGDGTLNIDMQNSIGSAIGINSGNFVVNSGTINIQLPNEGGIGITNHNRDDDNNYEFNGGVLNINAPEKSLTNRRYGIIVNGGTMKVSNAEININLGVKVNGRRDGLAEVEVLGIDIGSMGIKHLDDGDIERYPIGGKLILDNAHIKILAGEAYQICCTEIEDLSKNHRYYIGKTAASKEVKFSEAFDKRNEIGYEQLMRDSYDVNDNPNAGWHYLEITPETVELVEEPEDSSNKNNNQENTEDANETVDTELKEVQIDGLNVFLTTDKKEYQMGEIVSATLTAENISDMALNNLLMEIDIPNGFEIVDDSQNHKEINTIEPGKSAVITVQYKKTAGAQAASVSNITTRDTGSGRVTQINSPKTGEHSNTWIWVVLGIVATGAIVILIFRKKVLKIFIILFIVGAVAFGSLGLSSVGNFAYANLTEEGIITAENEIIYDGANVNISGRVLVNDGDLIKVYYDDNNKYAVSIEGEFSDVIVNNEADALNALESVKEYIGLTNPSSELTHSVTNESEYGKEYTYDQTYSGYYVLGRKVTVSALPNGKVDSLSSGACATEILEKVDLEPDISVEQANNIAVNKYSDIEDKTISDPILAIYPYGEYENAPILCYVINVNSESSVLNDNIYINANNGTVVNSISTIMYEEGYGNDEYGVRQSFPISKIPSYRYNPNSNNIYYMGNGSISVLDSDSPTREYNAPSRVSAYTNVLKTIDWYKKHTGWTLSSLGRGELTVAAIRDAVGFSTIGLLSSNIVNNAAYHTFSHSINFGACDSKYTMATVIDIVGHELTHCVFQHKTGSIILGLPVGQIGVHSLNEGYADVFGAFIKHDLNPSGNMWIHNEERAGSKNNSGRNGIDPHLTNQPKKIGDKYYIGNNSQYGSHKDCSLVFHAAYLMSSYGMDLNSLEKLWYQSMSMGYDDKSDFKTLRSNILKAANKLNFSQNYKNIIERAFAEEGIGEYKTTTVKKVTVEKKSTPAVTPQKSNNVVSGNFKLTIVNSSGKIIPSASVELYQTNDAIINGKKGNDVRVNMSKDSSGAYFCNLKSGQSYGLKNLVLPSGYSNPNLNQYFDAFIRLDYTKNRTYDGLVCTSVVGNDPKRTSFSNIVQITDSNSKDGRVEIKIKV